MSALQTCSPSMPSLCYPSPTSSNGTGQDSPPSDSINITQDDMSFSGRLQNLSQNFFCGEALESSFVPMCSLLESDMEHLSPINTIPYPLFQLEQWLPYTTTYSQPSPVTAFVYTASTKSPPLETSMTPFFTNLKRPMPQHIAPVNFDFTTLPSFATQMQHLSATSSFSQQCSHNSSLSSRSRSSSPTKCQLAGSRTSSRLRSTWRSNSTFSDGSLYAYGVPVTDPNSTSGKPVWRCAYPGCTSRVTFTRGCDLRKHHSRHSTQLFCRVDGCPQSQAAAASRSTDRTLTGGFSSKKDRARHEAKHNPGIKCGWKDPQGEGCGRIFSRTDNMKDHVRRIHKKCQQRSSRSRFQKMKH